MKHRRHYRDGAEQGCVGQREAMEPGACIELGNLAKEAACLFINISGAFWVLAGASSHQGVSLSLCLSICPWQLKGLFFFRGVCSSTSWPRTELRFLGAGEEAEAATRQ
ncbi:hypothetical protein E2320_012789, partial [Naja naja]